ncbi:hypothetical protein KC909_03010 [Candidatus Dojkabacteria bacterium]|uniref:Uncharacterized protein n=1 Tax=Candidatus Dojkabacteria bacterium TaxID=2099670 RepID=A0A955RJC6_9BACT|nr:hypothetical protein [Candidatus Dojkabacteria bacterium]
MLSPDFGSFSGTIDQFKDPNEIILTTGLVEPEQLEGIIPITFQTDYEIWPGVNTFTASPALMAMLERGWGEFGYMLFYDRSAQLNKVHINRHAGLKPTLAAYPDKHPLQTLADAFIHGETAQLPEDQMDSARKIAGNLLHTIKLGSTGLLVRSLYGDSGVEQFFAQVDPSLHFAYGVNLINQFRSSRGDLSDTELRQIMLYRYGFMTGTPIDNESAALKAKVIKPYGNNTYKKVQAIGLAIKGALAEHQDTDALDSSRKTIDIVKSVTSTGYTPELLPQMRAQSMEDTIAGYKIPTPEYYGHSAWQIENEVTQLVANMPRRESLRMGFNAQNLEVIMGVYRRTAVLANPFPEGVRSESNSPVDVYDELLANYQAAARQVTFRQAVESTNELLTSRGITDLYEVPRDINPHTEGLPVNLGYFLQQNLQIETLAELTTAITDLADIRTELDLYRADPQYGTQAANLLSSLDSLYADMHASYRQLVEYFIQVDQDAETIPCTVSISGHGNITQIEDADVVMIGQRPIVVNTGSYEFILQPDKIYYFNNVGCIPGVNRIRKVAPTGNGYGLIPYNIIGVQPNARRRRSIRSRRQL